MVLTRNRHGIVPQRKLLPRRPVPIHHIFKNGLLLLEFDLPGEKVNKFTAEVLAFLERTIDDVEWDDSIKGIIFYSGKDNTFIAGADINEIQAIQTVEEGMEKSRAGQRVFRRLEALGVPTLAAIHGACLGGGLEMALACKYRMASNHPRTVLGLPEVNLGIIPGWGGTQRLPRLIGLEEALQTILSGKPMDAMKARRIGLVDWIVPKERLLELAQEKMKKRIASQTPGSEKRKAKTYRRWLLEGNPLGRALLFRQAAASLGLKIGPQYPAPWKALEVIRSTLGALPGSGDDVEAKALAELACSEVSKNLVRVFRLSERSRKRMIDGVEPEMAVKRVGVLGAGTMGAGIAQVISYREIPVRLRDISPEALARGLKTIHKRYAEAVSRRKLRDRECQARISLVSPSTELAGLGLCDLVIEAAVEDLELKKKILAEAESQMNGSAILASNTSSLSITEMGKALQRPERFIGIHFFNPPHRMPLVEIIPGQRTSKAVLASAVEFCKRIGKTPVVVADRPGFLVNRILLPCLNEAGLLFEEGCLIQEIDYAMKNFGMPMGPLELADEVGIDICAEVAQSIFSRIDRQYPFTECLKLLHEEGRLGKKSGSGFYLHEKRGKTPDDAGLLDLLRGRTGPRETTFSEKEIQDRMILVMLNEAFSCLRERVVEQPEDVDMAMIQGTGFPPFRGGLLRHADSIGSENIVARLNELHRQAGERYKPDALIVEMAEKGKSFY